VPVLPQETAFDHRLVAGVAWTSGGSTNLVVATLTRWWALVSGGFMDVTGDDDTQSSDANTPVRLLQFGQGSVTNPTGTFHGDAVYGINGADHDVLHRWIATDPPQLYAPVIDAAHGNFSLAAADMAIVADRLVVVDTTESGVEFPRRVRWSSVLDGSSWPPLAFSDREGTGNCVAIRVTSRTTAVIYCETGAWIMSAQEGTDAGAFAFDRIQDVTEPPLSPNAIIEFGGRHVYLTRDANIWECDGQSARVISQAIDESLLNLLATVPAQKPVGVYDVRNHRLIFFVTFVPDSEAFNAVVFNLFTGAWEPPWRFHDAVTMAVPITEMFGPTWDNPGTDAMGNPYTWDSAPWASWNAIPENFQTSIYIGTPTGLLARAFRSSSDNGVGIPFFAQWGLRGAGDMTQRLEINTVEALLVPTQTWEEPTVRLSGLRTPFDSTLVPILARQLDLTNPAVWLVRLDPTVAVSAFRPSNFFQFRLEGRTVIQAPHYGGGTLFAFVIQRPDVQVGVTANV
jgi:hypothetical protein